MCPKNRELDVNQTSPETWNDNRSASLLFFFQLMIAAVVQVSKLVWKLKTLTLSVGPTPALGAGKMATL